MIPPEPSEYAPVKIRSLGVGSGSIRLGSPGFEEGSSILVRGSTINGPMTYLGPPNMIVAEVNGEGERVGELRTISLPEGSSRVLLVGVSPPGGGWRFFALSDEYGEEDRRMVSVLNITSMDLFVKLEDETGAIKRGDVFRESFRLGEDQKRLSIAMIGEKGGERIPLVNSRLRILQGRDLTLVVTGAEMTREAFFSPEQVEFAYVYHPPLLDDRDRKTEGTGGDSVTIQIQGGDF